MREMEHVHMNRTDLEQYNYDIKADKATAALLSDSPLCSSTLGLNSRGCGCLALR